MINKKNTKSFLLVVMSNLVRLFSSFASIFLLPLIFSKQDYGFYKLFLLYLSYVGLFHFGFIDGIYLKFGGVDYDDLPKEKFRSFSKFMFSLQAFITILGFLSSFFLSGERQIILSLVSLSLFAQNMTSYFQFISQITSRFKEFAISNILSTILNLILIGVFYVFSYDSYLIFLIVVVIINYFILFWYITRYKQLIMGQSEKVDKNNLLIMFKLGIPLLISNLIVTFMNTLPRQFVEIMYPVEIFPNEFSNFSFAFTLMGFTSVFLSAIGLVIYPMLKKSSLEELKNNYKKLSSLLLITLFFAFCAYFPLDFVVNSFLPEYTESLKIFLIMVPSIAFTSLVTVLLHNYYKSLNLNKQFLYIGLIGIVELIICISIGYFIIEKSLISITISTIIGICIWYLLTEFYLMKALRLSNFKNILFLISSSILFYLNSLIEAWYIAFVIYLVTIMLYVLIYYNNEAMAIINKLKSKIKKEE